MSTNQEIFCPRMRNHLAMKCGSITNSTRTEIGRNVSYPFGTNPIPSFSARISNAERSSTTFDCRSLANRLQNLQGRLSYNRVTVKVPRPRLQLRVPHSRIILPCCPETNVLCGSGAKLSHLIPIRSQGWLPYLRQPLLLMRQFCYVSSAASSSEATATFAVLHRFYRVTKPTRWLRN